VWPPPSSGRAGDRLARAQDCGFRESGEDGFFAEQFAAGVGGVVGFIDAECRHVDEVFYTGGLGHLRQFFGTALMDVEEALLAGFEHEAGEVDDGVGILDFTAKRFRLGDIAAHEHNLADIAGGFERAREIRSARDDADRIARHRQKFHHITPDESRTADNRNNPLFHNPRRPMIDKATIKANYVENSTFLTTRTGTVCSRTALSTFYYVPLISQVLFGSFDFKNGR